MMKKTLALAALAAIAVAGSAEARDQIRIVGSSTVYPFATTVAEQFGKTTSFKTPVIESTGSGGGFKLFCAGVGVEHPDVTNASRAIKKSEIETCKKNGVTSVTEVKIGYDGIVIANSKNAPQMNVTREQIFLALAKQIPVDGKLVDNPYQKWSDIDKGLPDAKIEVLGPPPTSGTRDAFVELVMDHGCEQVPGAEAAGLKGKACGALREDGGYIEAGENDVLIVRKLEANKDAFGIFGYSYLDQNADKIQGTVVEGVQPTFENIANGSYPVSRPLFFYVKNAHVGTIPGIKEYVAEFTSEKAWGMDGYLADKGLVPMPDAERKQYHDDAANMTSNIM
jgi:phosphate transport system substrate-binding protein